jgi:dienelactone hydrolase
MIPACLPEAFWPEGEGLSAEFVRLLSAAQEGGSSIAECLLIARRLRKGDDLSWHIEWKNLAEANRKRGDAALASGHLATARRNWLRAINYYNAALFPLDSSDEKRWASIVAMQECARSVLRYLDPAGEVVTLPWLSGHSLQGYFLPASSSSEPAPAVICIGEPGRRKEEFLFKLAPHARERGLSMLAIDLLGEHRDDFLDDIVRRQDVESSISHVVDYLSSRADVDDSRIAIVADAWGSSFVARAAASESRLAAAVCDGGLWDLHERTFLANRAMRHDGQIGPRPGTSRIARNMNCPVLITLGEHGWLEPDRVRHMVHELRTHGSDITFKVFTASETAAEQGHADNPSLANEYIFDWLASQLGMLPVRPD